MDGGVGAGPALGPVRPRSFYERSSLEVARDLLGSVVERGEVAVRVTEVEAYTGLTDPASHAYRGRSRRNGVMFGPGGHAYVYFTYGMHWCLNLVCGPDGEAAAVLLRAGEVVAGLDVARSRAGRRRGPALARGPACLTQVLGITGALDGVDVTGPSEELMVRAAEAVPDDVVSRGPRVGISVALERPWRLWVAGDPTVSRARPPRRAPREP